MHRQLEELVKIGSGPGDGCIVVEPRSDSHYRYTPSMLPKIEQCCVTCVLMGLATGCFSEPPPVGDDASSGGTSTATTGTEGSSAQTTASTLTEGEADSGPSSSGEDTVGRTDSTGTESVGTLGSGTDADTEGETEDTGTDTGRLESCTVIYLNFDGVTLTPGNADDATLDISSVGLDELTGGPLLPYAGDAPPIVSAVSDHLGSFDVCLVTERPNTGDYEMVVITGTESPFGGAIALSPGADCGNSNRREISFVFGSNGAIPGLAEAVSSRIGFHIGLENGTQPADLMGPPGHPGPTFLDQCTELNAPPACGAQHATHCDAGSQNSFQELLDAFGSSDP